MQLTTGTSDYNNFNWFCGYSSDITKDGFWRMEISETFLTGQCTCTGEFWADAAIWEGTMIAEVST